MASLWVAHLGSRSVYAGVVLRRSALLSVSLSAGHSKARDAFVVLDGTLIAVDRVAADRPFYSGKHRKQA
jgi:hypothetical protein